MIQRAREHIQKGRWGLLIAFGLIFAAAYTIIWAAIEPLEIPDELAVSLPRWALHGMVSVLTAAFLTMALVIAVRRPDPPQVTILPFDHLYTVGEAPAFYDAIATRYDNRNSASLLQTHSKVVERIREQAKRKADLRVLDLGGGTGKGIAHHFFDNQQISWDYVDSSPSMISQFRKNLENTGLKYDIHFSSIEDFVGRKPNGQYDVIMLSLVLTSMPVNPDWEVVAGLLAEGGVLIIADIDAAYTAIHPYYVIEVGTERHGLEPRPIPVTELIDQINQKHLRFSHSYPVREGAQSYSFIAEFVKEPAAAPKVRKHHQERATYYVSAYEGQWKIRHKDREYLYDTQRAALNAAIDAAYVSGEEGYEGQVLLQAQDGVWRAEWTYGLDAAPPRN